MFLNGIVLGTIFLGGKLITTSSLDPGQLMSFLMVTQMLQHSLGQFSLLFGHYVKGIAAGSRIFEVGKLKFFFSFNSIQYCS